MRRKQIVDYFVYVAVRLLICMVQAMRPETGARVARRLAWLFHQGLGIRRRVVDENLAHAYPKMTADERYRLARGMWEHLFLLVLEVAHAPRKIHETNWRDYVTLRNHDRIVRCLLSDRPTLIITAHYGNFEVAGYTLGLLGFPVWTVARTLDNAYLDRFLARFRSSQGARLIPKVGGYDQIVRVLGAGESMAFLADQYAGPKGCWVEFFGRKASAHKAIALLALENDAQLVIATARRTGGPLVLEVDTSAEIDPHDDEADIGSIRDLTQWYTSRLEEVIRRSPEQYWWLHRRWKDTRTPRRKKKTADRQRAA